LHSTLAARPHRLPVAPGAGLTRGPRQWAAERINLDQGGSRACCRAKGGDVPGARVVQANGQRWQPLHIHALFGVPPAPDMFWATTSETMARARGGAGRAPCMPLPALRPPPCMPLQFSAQCTDGVSWPGRTRRQGKHAHLYMMCSPQLSPLFMPLMQRSNFGPPCMLARHLLYIHALRNHTRAKQDRLPAAAP